MTATDPDYLSVHVFYNVSDLRALLLELVEPLVRRLEAASMIRRYFVVRYWEGGAHVRLRLLPTPETSHEQLRSELEPAIDRFLRERPSLFDPDPAVMQPLMRLLYVMEYGEQAFVQAYGADGVVPLRKNNSYAYIAYEPEYRRYGGVHGVALSERHFHSSSRIALAALRDVKIHVRGSTLGLAFQLMLHFAFAFFETRERTAAFFEGYAEFFRGVDLSTPLTTQFDKVFARQSDRVQEQVERLEVFNERLARTDRGVLGDYVRDACELRQEVRRLHDEGALAFEPPVQSWQEAGSRLLTSYLHMMNNRLGVLIIEEVYMAHMIVRALAREPVLASIA